MKVLVLSCSTGGGHNSCAKYIKEELEANGIKTIFSDFYDIVNEKAKDLSSKIYLSTVGNNGEVFKTFYKLGEMYSKTKITSPVYLVNKIHKKKLYNYIEENNFDLVITTHLFPGLTLTAINKDESLGKIKFIMVSTDYEPCPFVEEVKPNYLVIQKGLENRFIRKKIEKDILLDYGIPVSSKFTDGAKSIRKKFNLEKDESLVLIMLGSMGFGKILDTIDKILSINKIKVIVVCGSNKELYNELNRIDNDNLIVLGFVDNINDLIYSSDIVLSKPGGLSSTEIASIGKPLLHVFPIPGIETYNVEYFSENKMCLKCENDNDIVNNINLLIKNKKLRENLINNQHKIINKSSGRDLVNFILDHYKTDEF